MLFAGNVRLLLGFVLEFAVVQNFADRWISVWGNFYEIEAGILGSFTGFAGINDS